MANTACLGWLIDRKNKEDQKYRQNHIGNRWNQHFIQEKMCYRDFTFNRCLVVTQRFISNPKSADVLLWRLRRDTTAVGRTRAHCLWCGVIWCGGGTILPRPEHRYWRRNSRSRPRNQFHNEAVAERFIEEYFVDMDKLNILQGHWISRATLQWTALSGWFTN